MVILGARRKGTSSSSDNIALRAMKHFFIFSSLLLAFVFYNALDSGDEAFATILAARAELAGGRQEFCGDGDANAAAVKEWRQSVTDQCQAAASSEPSAQAQAYASVRASITGEGFRTPPLRRQIDYGARVPPVIGRCRNVVIDFGANVGDSIGKIIDGGMPGCPAASMAEPVFLQGDEKIDSGRWNGVSNYFRERMVEADKVLGAGAGGQQRGPEDYCMYGVEGNPTFTVGLQKVEQYVMSLEPRPLRHLHVFTGTVGAGKDGPTEIFLDTVNEDKNFWGSSIISSHRDVKAGAVAHDGGKKADTMVATPVQGTTLTSLMRSTLSAYDPHATEDDQKGGHLFVKIDIEGGEYQVFNEGFDSGIFCEFVKKGNSLDILVEFHTENLIGKNDDLRRYYKDVKEPLLACGVNIKRLPGGWA